jgi:hypothetical protein
MYPHITHTKYLPLSEQKYTKTKTAPKGSYEEKTETVSESAVLLLQSNDSKNRGSKAVCL